MCLFFIFGVTPRDKVMGREMRFCPYCGRETMHTIVERRMWFTLFFIPLFPVSGKQTIALCETCGIPDTSRPEFRQTLRRTTRVCPNCGEEIPERAQFCPSCGHPLG